MYLKKLFILTAYAYAAGSFYFTSCIQAETPALGGAGPISKQKNSSDASLERIKIDPKIKNFLQIFLNKEFLDPNTREENAPPASSPHPLISKSKIQAFLFDMQSILVNEDFTVQQVFIDNDSSIRNCMLESPSSVWIIKYCHAGEVKTKEPWYLFLSGYFLIKSSDKYLDYNLRRESHIYTNIHYGSLAFNTSLNKRYVRLMKVHLIDGDFAINVGWSKKRLPFLQALAQKQLQIIYQTSISHPSL